MSQPKAPACAEKWEGVHSEVPEWFRDAKFGLFFHWAPYSVPACENEWYSRNMYNKGQKQNLWHREHFGKLSDFGYKDFYPLFRGENFSAEKWADLIVRSGAKYAGPVTEHADNFSLWNSRINPCNSVNYGPKRDIVGEMEKELRARGIKFIATFHHQWLWGWFMSSDPDADVYDPENEEFYGPSLPLEANRYIPYNLPDDKFCRTWFEKVKEVIDDHCPDLIYFDSRTNIIMEKYRRMMAEYYYSKKSSGVLTYKQEDFPADVGVLDKECGRFAEIQPFPWQTDDRLEARRTWCHVEGALYKTGGQIIRQLCDIVSKNGNLLLNVGPKADGTFEPEAEKSLYEIGDWLSVNGEAIYGTRPYIVFGEGVVNADDRNFDISQISEQTKTGVFDEKGDNELSARDVRYTTRGNTLYAIVMGKPDSSHITLACVAPENGFFGSGKLRAELIDNTPLECAFENGGLRITLPGKLRDAGAKDNPFVIKIH